jgi:hypothetical protein
MVRRVDRGLVVFQCPCGHEEKGNGSDRRLDYGVAQGEQTQKYDTLLRVAPHSRAELQVERECGGCGLPFMTMIAAGEERSIHWSCGCGRIER